MHISIYRGSVAGQWLTNNTYPYGIYLSNNDDRSTLMSLFSSTRFSIYMATGGKRGGRGSGYEVCVEGQNTKMGKKERRQKIWKNKQVSRNDTRISTFIIRSHYANERISDRDDNVWMKSIEASIAITKSNHG